YYPGAQSVFDDLGVLKDNLLPIDDLSRGDLRVQVPGKNIAKFLTWYDSARNRENDPKREFREELYGANILPGEKFGEPLVHRLRQHVSSIQPCRHLDG